MYVFNKKKKVYTLKQNPTLRQVLSLYTILYPALRRGVTPVYTFQNKLIVKEAVDFIITTIKELSFIEQHILFLYVSFVSQKKISSLLKLSEPKVTQRKRRIENFFTRKVNDFYGVSGQNNNCISLKILREVDYFRSCYFSYLKKTGFKGFSKKK